MGRGGSGDCEHEAKMSLQKKELQSGQRFLVMRKLPTRMSISSLSGASILGREDGLGSGFACEGE